MDTPKKGIAVNPMTQIALRPRAAAAEGTVYDRAPRVSSLRREGGMLNDVLIGLHPSSARSSARMRLAMLAVCRWLFFAWLAAPALGFMSGVADVGPGVTGERNVMSISSSDSLSESNS